MKIRQWNEIEEDFNHSIILGNGASIAVDSRLHYSSLFEAANSEGFITSEVSQIFEHFDTNDFEFVLQALANAHSINSFLGITESKSGEAYGQVKKSLIQTVDSVHPTFEEVSDDLLAIATFLKRFDVVFSLNYDLILYWAMLRGNEHFGSNRFKDCFSGEGTFTYENDFLRKPYSGNDGATLVFYPHGSLFLGSNAFGEETKLISDNKPLTQVIGNRWRLGGIVPLFVSEGDSTRKVRSIRRNGYLNYVFSQELCRSTESLVIYGWSAADQDDHILGAIKQSHPKRVAISIWEGSSDPKNDVYVIRRKVRRVLGLDENKIEFFSSESPGAWKNINK